MGDINFADCSFAEPGTFPDPDEENEDPDGGGTVIVHPDPPTPAGDVKTGTWPPPDNGGGGGGPPDDIIIVVPPNLKCQPQEDTEPIIGCMDPTADDYDPDATIPCDNCCEYGGEGGGGGGPTTGEGDPTIETLLSDVEVFSFNFEQFIPSDVPGYEGTTVFDSTLPDQPFSINIETISLSFEGSEINSIPGANIVGEIKDLPNVGAATNTPFFQITLPTTPEAIQYYKDNDITGTVRANFDIVYLSDIPGGEVELVELHRDNVDITTAIEVEVLGDDPPDPTDPVIEYPQPMIMHYNADSEAQETYSPTQWDLGGNVVESYVIDVIPSYPAFPPEEKYSPEDILFNEETGQVTLLPFQGDLSERLPGGIRITLFFSFSQSQQFVIPLLPISDAPTEPQFSYEGTTAVLYYNAPFDAEPTIAIPSVWDVAGNEVSFEVGQLQVIPAGDDGEGNTWPSDPGDIQSAELSFDPITGAISVTPFTGAFSVGNLPGDSISVIIFWSTSDGEYSDTIVTEVPLALAEWPGSNLAFTAGGGQGNTLVQNPVTGGRINIPNTYLTQNRNQQNITPVARVGRRNGGVARSNVVVKARPLSTEAQIRKLKSSAFTNGITSQNFTFYQTFVPSPFLSENLGTTGVDLFSGKEDFTIRAIQEINRNPQLYEDFAYNSITSKKVEDSFSEPVKALLQGKVFSDGRPLAKVLSSAVKDALIFDEEKLFNLNSIQQLTESGQFSTVEIYKRSSSALNQRDAVNLLINNSLPLDPNEYNIKNKNRLLNWKILAEDIDKRVVYKKSDLTETNIYLPNAETLTVVDSTGTSHTIDMQDGDYFSVDTVDSVDRLTVFSDRDKAKILNLQDTSRAFNLCNKTYKIDISCSTPPSSLVELSVDLNTPRQDYYILTLDKTSIVDQVSTDPLFKSTKATYNYVTDTATIDDYIKNKVFPHFTVMIRDDDMFINHLEAGASVTASFQDLSLDNYSNTPDDVYVRRIPWFFVIVPSDKTSEVFSHRRSKFEDFNTRVLSVVPAPQVKNHSTGTWAQQFISETVVTEGGVNFGVDIRDGVIYQENREYSINYTALNDFDNYTTGAPTVPRKRLPVNETLLEVCSIKTDFSLGERDSMSFYDLYTRLKPSVFRSLGNDTNNLDTFKNNLTRNTVSTDKDVNDTYFVKVKELSNISNKTPTVLSDDDATTTVSIFSKSKTTAEDVGAAAPAPEDRSGDIGGVV